MLRPALVVTFTLLVTLLAGTAESADRVDPRFVGGTPAERSMCQQLANSQPPRKGEGTAGASAADVETCLRLIRTVADGSTAAASDDAPFLLATFRALQLLNPWVEWSTPAGGERKRDAEMATIEAELRARLDAHGLTGGPYAALIHASFGLAEGGGYKDQPANTPTAGTAFAAMGVQVETAHLQIAGGWDFGLTFDAALEPLFVMVNVPGVDGVTPAYIHGFSTTTGPRISWGAHSLEIAAAGRIGASRLHSMSVGVEDTNGVDQTATVANNDTGQWAFFFDARGDFRWYPRELWLVHLRNRTLTPIIHAYGGVKHDERFHRGGDLQEFVDPTGRVFFGFNLQPVQLWERGSMGDRLLTLGAGFSYEAALRKTHRLPSGYRVFVSAAFDLAGAIR